MHAGSVILFMAIREAQLVGRAVAGGVLVTRNAATGVCRPIARGLQHYLCNTIVGGVPHVRKYMYYGSTYVHVRKYRATQPSRGHLLPPAAALRCSARSACMPAPAAPAACACSAFYACSTSSARPTSILTKLECYKLAFVGPVAAAMLPSDLPRHRNPPATARPTS